MANERIGRNDPCPCGSGKKYKRCCLAADERSAAAQRAAAPPPEPAPEPARALLDPHRLAASLQELARQAPKEGGDEFGRLLAEAQPILAYMERQPEIEAATEALEAHRTEFEKLAEDKEAYLQRTHALFAEERFAPLRFTAEDVRRAFGKVGQPPNLAADDRFVEAVRAAILHLASKERRGRLAMSLLGFLPDYVAAGRHLDAWIVQDCAYITGNAPDDSNPFLFEMFSYGYDAWAAEQRARDAAMLREVGIDLSRLEGMSMDAIDAWLEQEQVDPAKKARLEAILLAHPDERALAIANLEAMERSSVTLLDRADAAGLLLTPEELEPWLPRLNECLASLGSELPDPAEPIPDPAVGDLLLQAIRPVLSDMAETLFTPERRQQLAAQLRAYRNDLFSAGDKRAAGYAQVAMASVEREDEPGKNYFLNVLCFTSLRSPSLWDWLERRHVDTGARDRP